MKIEVLLATMFFEQESDKFLDSMNIQSDIIIGNQSESVKNEKYIYNGHNVTVLSRDERGIGRNRNLCLFSSTADIVLFSDNDVHYYDEYVSKIEKFYSNHPKADVVIFNFKQQRGDEPLHDINLKNKKAKLKDLTKFGACVVSVRRESVLRKRINFSLLFGASKYGCGEDTLFLMDCYKAGLNIYLSSDTLGEVINRESTWFKGLTEKYILDKGALFRAMSPKMYYIFIVRHVIKHRKFYLQYGKIRKVISTMRKGAKEYGA